MNTMLDKNLISRCSWQLWILAALAVLVFPGTLSNSVWLGQTWLWLIATPATMLLVIHRHCFAAAWSTALVNSPSRRRRQPLQAQARRKGFGRVNVRQNPMRAA